MAHTGTARARRVQVERGPAGRRRAGKLVFLREFLRRPGQLGTCFTSTRALSRKMVEGMGLAHAAAVIELGPGPGPVTAEIVSRLGPGCRFFAVEQNAELAEFLRERFPGVRVLADDAARIETLCRREGMTPGEVDCVISGVPFLLLDEPAQRKILSAVVKVLKPGGLYSQVTYGAEGLYPKAKKFRKVLESFFTEVRRQGPVLANVPPAFVYKCRL